uniref:Uncharacterized protein n=1 Tax=Caenorhabditis japonica TaxID=281687 RepID=A0A8R1IIH1_CAEJA
MSLLQQFLPLSPPFYPHYLVSCSKKQTTDRRNCSFVVTPLEPFLRSVPPSQSPNLNFSDFTALLPSWQRPLFRLLSKNHTFMTSS